MYVRKIDSSPAPVDNAAIMAQASQPPLVKMICGMISADKALFDEALTPLTNLLGPVDLVSDVMDFDFTHYYDQEMGHPLLRRFVSFERLITPDILIEAKLATNAIEEDFAARHGRQSGQPARPERPINLDPGYIALSKLVLASMKNFSHRIYLGRGVFAEVTLMYHKNRWDALAWTFPDYAAEQYHSFLTAVRERLRVSKEEEKQQI